MKRQSRQGIKPREMEPSRDLIFLYHTTAQTNIKSIAKKGLKQSANGQFGQGIYFAATENDLAKWSRKGDILLRVARDIANAIGNLEEFPGQELKLFSTFAIPPEYLEVKTPKSGWQPLPAANCCPNYFFSSR